MEINSPSQLETLHCYKISKLIVNYGKGGSYNNRITVNDDALMEPLVLWYFQNRTVPVDIYLDSCVPISKDKFDEYAAAIDKLNFNIITSKIKKIN